MKSKWSQKEHKWRTGVGLINPMGDFYTETRKARACRSKTVATSLQKKVVVGRIEDCQAEAKEIGSSAGTCTRNHGLLLNRLWFPSRLHPPMQTGNAEDSPDNPRWQLWWINDSNTSSGGALTMTWVAREISNSFISGVYCEQSLVATWNIVLRNILKAAFWKNAMIGHLCLLRA